MITRLAPTPSGYLHEGNAVNLLLVHWLAAAHDGTIALRIDDMDAARARTEYLSDIFGVLAWLEIGWTSGPASLEEADETSLRHRAAYYRAEVLLARRRGLDAYACACSRRQVGAVASGGCPGGCRDLHLPLVAGRTALRVHVPVGTTIDVAGSTVDLASTVGDFVLWRRDDVPAYHLVSVIEDRDLGTTHIVRGLDLLPSTAAQLFLAPHLGASGVLDAAYLHHGLVAGPDGAKLSKSQLVGGRPLPRDEAARSRIHAQTVALGEPLGIRPPT